jgi:hypothetical protein
VPLGPDRLLGYTGHFLDSTFKKLEERVGKRWKDRVMWAFLAVVFIVFVAPCALAALALYPSVLIYVYLVHGYGAYTGTQKKLISGQNTESRAAFPGEIAHYDAPGNTQSSNEIHKNTSCTESFLTFLKRPIVALTESLKENQNVSRHMLCLPDMGSLKMLKVFF